YINFKHKIHNIEFDKLGIQSFEEKIKNEFGYQIEVENISDIDIYIKKAIQNKISQKVLDEFIKKYISNIGTSAYVVANEIKKKLKD
ncbi:hypothetical protein OA177_02000, partial [Candidatus Pelagibacter sp.]|nr:hypothetical protein [Candidatus Pelagibacter sp.]